MSNYLFAVPVVDGEAVLPRDEINAILKGTKFCLRVLGRNANRKQFANKSSHRHQQLRQNFPVRHSTHAVVYLRDYSTEWRGEAVERLVVDLLKAKFSYLFWNSDKYHKHRTLKY